ncbi:hypothetical protein AUJ46_06550 [Candidatus Peregrinibacteria bacterium CG1_02_54_53]|nr:MAG: hypothetical protein AUJ46_06550 [Candidatus Peregrinibacteria bacterium CG1_02_54_53]
MQQKYLILKSVVALAALCVMTNTKAAESTSYRFESDPITVTQGATGVSNTYRWLEGNLTLPAISSDPSPDDEAEQQELDSPDNDTNASHAEGGGGGRPGNSPTTVSNEATVASTQNTTIVASKTHADISPSPAIENGQIIPAEEQKHPAMQRPAAAQIADSESEVSAATDQAEHISFTQPQVSATAEQKWPSLTAQLLNAVMPGSTTTGATIILLELIGVGFIFKAILLRRRRKHPGMQRTQRKRARAPRRKTHASKVIALTILLLGSILPSIVAAQTTVPRRLHYSGRLYDAQGSPITTTHQMRFSLWTSRDFADGDTTASGAIHVTADQFTGWQEVQSVTPQTTGQITVELGAESALPDFGTLSAEALLSLSLQVEVKAADAQDSTYELLDADSNDAAIDRFSLLSVPFALNADMLDQHDIGTGSGSIPLLGSGGMISLQNMGRGTNQSTFTINAQNTAADAVLTFGNDLLPATIAFSAQLQRFEFSDAVHVQGDLTASGTLTVQDDARFNSTLTINGVRYAFPSTDATSGSVLKTDGSGNLSWSDDHNAPQSAAFVDAETESLADANVDLWDGMYPNITLSESSHVVLVNVTLNGTADAGDKESDAFTIHRAIDADPTCTDTIIGGVFSGTPTTRKYDTWSATASFLDIPSTTGNARYTICSSDAATTGGTISNDAAEIHFSLIKLGN